jgi:hypothetical protein
MRVGFDVWSLQCSGVMRDEPWRQGMPFSVSMTNCPVAMRLVHLWECLYETLKNEKNVVVESRANQHYSSARMASRMTCCSTQALCDVHTHCLACAVHMHSGLQQRWSFHYTPPRPIFQSVCPLSCAHAIRSASKRGTDAANTLCVWALSDDLEAHVVVLGPLLGCRLVAKRRKVERDKPALQGEVGIDARRLVQ